jgi:hypothetical protein
MKMFKLRLFRRFILSKLSVHFKLKVVFAVFQPDNKSSGYTFY